MNLATSRTNTPAPIIYYQVDHVLPPDAGLELEKALGDGRAVGSLTRLLGSCVSVIPINWQRTDIIDTDLP